MNMKPVKYTKRQVVTADNYLNPKNKITFGNLYQSAIAAGFSKSYAAVLTQRARDLAWVNELKAQMTTYEPDHIYRAFQDVAQHGAQDRDRLKALELMGKARGMFVDRIQQDVHVKFVNDVPRPKTEIIDVEDNKNT